jgi:hypothetical protein
MKHLLTLGALCLTAGAAQATASTSGSTAWSTAGDVLAGAGGSLALSTAYAAPGDPDAAFNLSGTSAAEIALVEAGAGVAAYALDLGDEAATEGSVAWRSFAVGAGDTLRFDWGFATAETDFLDHAFAVLDGQVITLAVQGGLASAGTFSHVFDQGGVARLAVGVVDTMDVLGVSTLTLSNLALTPAVPEPAAAWLMLAGGAALLLRRKRPQAR